MRDATTEKPHANYARFAGLTYLGVTLCAVFAEFFVRARLTVPGDAGATTTNILAHQSLFRAGLVSDLFLLVLEPLLALALFVLLKPVNRNLALLALFFNLIRVPVLAANSLSHLAVLLVLGGSEYMSAFSAAQTHGLVMLFLDLHKHGYTAAGMVFGPWCFITGYLIVRSAYIPRVLGVLMMLAMFGYVTDLLVAFLAPEYKAAIAPIALTPAALGEISFCLWLLFMGGRVHRGFVSRLQQG